jgi:hypothetical protein
VIDRASFPTSTSKARIEKTFTIPREPQASTTIVTQVFPSASKLPENQLKLYLHFSAAMSRGDVYQHMHLLDDKGKEVSMPFLELQEELWDPKGQRFTLFFDPGRIKRGVKPRDDVGPPLTSGQSFTFRVDRAWQDADANPLKEDYIKKFEVTEPVADRVDISRWKVEAPAAGTSAPLVLEFPAPLDHALLHRMITVANDKGDKIAGTITVTDEEKRWRFEPAKPWRAGKYHLIIDKDLEDLAGNSVARPFEADVFRPIPREPKTETATLSFEVR